MKYFLITLILLCSQISYGQKAPYQLQLDAGFLFSEAYVPAFSIQVFNGIQIPDWSAEAGITTGIDHYEQMDLYPISLGVKWLPAIGRKWTPFLGLNAGIAIAKKDDLGQFQSAEGGSLLSPTAGLRFNNSHFIKWNVNVSYKVQKAKITSVDGFSDVPRFMSSEKYTFRRLFLGFGFSF